MPRIFYVSQLARLEKKEKKLKRINIFFLKMNSFI